MRLPMLSAAKVPRAKIVLYLLNPEHRAGKGKARFFAGHGFAPERWQTLAEALRQHARDNEVSKQEATPLGTRCVVEGPMRLAEAQLPEFGPCGLLKPASGRRAS